MNRKIKVQIDLKFKVQLYLKNLFKSKIRLQKWLNNYNKILERSPKYNKLFKELLNLEWKVRKVKMKNLKIKIALKMILLIFHKNKNWYLQKRTFQIKIHKKYIKNNFQQNYQKFQTIKLFYKIKKIRLKQKKIQINLNLRKKTSFQINFQISKIKAQTNLFQNYSKI